MIGNNETGFKGSGDDVYRQQAWEFILVGGGLFNNLDYSFTVSHPDGNTTEYKAPRRRQPGSCGVSIARLHEFIESFDFVRMQPDHGAIKKVSIRRA